MLLFNGKIASFCIPPSNSISVLVHQSSRCTNLLALGGWIKGQPFALASFKKKQTKPFLSPGQKGIITTSYFQLLFAQTMFISDNKVSSACRLSCCLQSPCTHPHEYASFFFGLLFWPQPLIPLPYSDTLIVWTEPDGVDYALSFQDPEGCAEVWNFILEVQRHMNNSGSTSFDLT